MGKCRLKHGIDGGGWIYEEVLLKINWKFVCPWLLFFFQVPWSDKFFIFTNKLDVYWASLFTYFQINLCLLSLSVSRLNVWKIILRKLNLDLCNVLILLLGSQGYALTFTLTGAVKEKGGGGVS